MTGGFLIECLILPGEFTIIPQDMFQFDRGFALLLFPSEFPQVWRGEEAEHGDIECSPVLVLVTTAVPVGCFQYCGNWTVQ